MHRSIVGVLSVVLATSVSGCAVFLPYVHPDRSKRQDTSLTQAIAYAQDAKDKYHRAQNAYAGTATIIPYVAIPLAAAGLGLGITGTTGAPITALGLATGTAVAVGVWSQNKPRELAYNLGYKAINCLLQSIEPFQAAVAPEFHEAVFGDRTARPPKASLAEARNDLATQVLLLEAEVDALPPAQQAIWRPYVVSLKAYLDETLVVQTGGEQLAGAAFGVARNLVNNVDAVVGKINDAVRETTPNVQAVASAIAGLSVLQPAAMPSVPASKPPESPTKGQKLLAVVPAPTQARLDQVEAAVNAVAALATVIRVAIVKSQYTKGTPTIASCLEIPDSFSAVVKATETSVRMTQGTTRRIGLVGGKGPFIASVAQGPPGADLTAAAKMDGGFFVEITASKTCPPTPADKPYKVRVTDAPGTGVEIAVNVDAAPPELVATPADLKIDTTKPATVVLKGGKVPYSHVVSGASNVTVAAVAGKTDSFTVTFGANATEGTVLFVDSSTPPLKVEVPVKK